MESATIVLRRSRRIWNSVASPYFVELDGIEVGRVRNGETATFQASVGRHVISLRSRGFNIQVGPLRVEPSSDPLEIYLVEGQVVKLFCEPSAFSGQLGGGASSKLIRLMQEGGSPSVSKPADYQVIKVVETATSEEPIGTEDRLISNPARSTTVTKSLRITREWTKTVRIEKERELKLGAKASVGGESWLKVEGSIEGALKRTFGVTETAREEFGEELTIQVSPASKVKVSLHWKRIWQHGVATVLGPDGEYDVPFKIARAITFDQSIADV